MEDNKHNLLIDLLAEVVLDSFVVRPTTESVNRYLEEVINRHQSDLVSVEGLQIAVLTACEGHVYGNRWELIYSTLPCLIRTIEMDEEASEKATRLVQVWEQAGERVERYLQSSGIEDWRG